MVEASPYGIAKHAECLLHDTLYVIAASVVLFTHVARVLVVCIGVIHIEERHVSVGTQLIPQSDLGKVIEVGTC